MKSHKNKDNNIDGENKIFDSVKKSAAIHASKGVGFSCPSMGKTFNVRELINKLKTCEVCSIKFDTKKEFDIHKKIHDSPMGTEVDLSNDKNQKDDLPKTNDKEVLLMKESNLSIVVKEDDFSKETEVDFSKETEVDFSEKTEVDSSKETEVDLSKETEVDLSKKTEVDSSKDHGVTKPEPNTEMEVDLSKNVELSDEFDSSSDINELEGKFNCTECAETFSAESNLKFHLDLQHDINDSQSILEVDENWNVEEDLNTQIDAVHEGKKPHECNYCHNGFADEQSLKTHMESRENQNPKNESSKFSLQIKTRNHSKVWLLRLCHLVSRRIFLQLLASPLQWARSPVV